MLSSNQGKGTPHHLLKGKGKKDVLPYPVVGEKEKKKKGGGGGRSKKGVKRGESYKPSSVDPSEGEGRRGVLTWLWGKGMILSRKEKEGKSLPPNLRRKERRPILCSQKKLESLTEEKRIKGYLINYFV